MMTEWNVEFPRKVEKAIRDLPPEQRHHLAMLVRALATSGPVQGSWANYSKLGKNQHHCHLSHRWVACWEVKSKAIRLIEIYYVGSRKDAPY
jgi:mRNA-degrading endonuclease RelE of RelBE toxin-antitoxin system